MDIHKFETMSNEELVALGQRGNQEAVDYLLKNHKSMVRMLSRSMYLMDGDKDDLLQEGMIALYDAIMKYDSQKGASFDTFAVMCINRKLINAIQASNCQKNSPLNGYISIDANKQDEDFMEQYEMPVSPQQNNPEDIIIHREEMETLLKRLESKLSSMEKKVLALFLQGLTYQEIAVAMNKTPKAIDNAIQRIKNKGK